MPIIDPPPEPRTPLGQGDILKGVTLYSTKQAWKDGGEARPSNSMMCLVLSRPCLALRDDWIVVAAIEKYRKSAPSSFEDYDEAKKFYIEIRDGLTTPDQFYLGQIEGAEGAYCARFDSLHTVQVPKENTADRQAFLADARIGRLHKDFAHDLHLRLFRAFASLGFDDHRWFSTGDLRAFVAVAARDEANEQLKVQEVKAKLEVGSSQGFKHASEETKLKSELAKLEVSLRALAEKMAPYKDELKSREEPDSRSTSSVPGP